MPLGEVLSPLKAPKPASNQNKEAPMKAVIQTGGKQFIVSKGDVIYVEKLDLEAGAEVQFDALMTFTEKKSTIGKPLVKEKVTGKVISQVKGEKIIVFKYKPKKKYRKKQGHRQPYTKVEILSIGEGTAAKKAPAKAKASAKEVKEAEEAPAAEAKEAVAVES
jgi:large subunit ribosomal protein L21